MIRTSISYNQAALDKFGHLTLSCRPEDLPAIGTLIDMQDLDDPHEGTTVVIGYATKEEYIAQAVSLGGSLHIRKERTKFFKVAAE